MLLLPVLVPAIKAQSLADAYSELFCHLVANVAYGLEHGFTKALNNAN